MKIELRKLADIRPYEHNPRHNDDAVEAVAASIREFGFRQPIVVDVEGVIICGHTRYKAALKLGLEKVPVHVARDVSLASNFVSKEAFDQMLHASFGNLARVLEPERGFTIWGGYANCANYPPVLKACELYFSQAIIWVKEHPVLTRKDSRGSRVERVELRWRQGRVVYLEEAG